MKNLVNRYIPFKICLQAGGDIIAFRLKSSPSLTLYYYLQVQNPESSHAG